MSRSRRPNVLVIMTDQHSATAMSCAGNTDVATPAIDSLAESGIRFRRAYCASPLCAPSRASMMTGRLPSQLGMDDNVAVPSTPFPDRCMGRIFAEAGYDCAYAGKWHVPGAVHYRSGDHGGPANQGVASGFTEIFSGGHEGLAQACANFLADPARQDKPFLLVASFNEPHGICEWARGQTPPSGEVDDVDWRELPVLPPNFAAGSEEPEALRLVQKYAWNVHPTQQWGAEQWRRYRYAYFRLVERVDAEIAALLSALSAAGLGDDTLIVLTADHGDMQGAHGWNQKKNLYEESAGVPFIVVPPAGATSAGIRDELVSVGLDLLPTLCDYADIPGEPDWLGSSVRPLVEQQSDDARPEVREHVVSETQWMYGGLMPPPAMAYLIARMLRTPRYKYVCYSWGRHREQLYDLSQDPGEMINLATSGAHQDVLADHRRRLAGHCDEVGDPFRRYVPAPGVAPR